MSIYRWITTLLLLFFTLGLSAQFKVEVTEGQISDYKIGAPNIVAKSSKGDKLAKKLSIVVRRDLNLSGFFTVLDPRSYLNKKETPVTKLVLPAWTQVGAQGVVKGFITVKDKVELKLVFFDVATGKSRIAKVYKGSPGAIQRSIHSFVKEVVFLLTKEQLTFFDSKIVFISKKQKKDGMLYQLILADFDAGNQKTLVSGKSILSLPAWSYDGKKIFYTSYVTGAPYLYAVTIATGKKQLMSSFPGLNSSVSSSPDGKNIVLRLSKDGNAELYLMNLKSRKVKRLTRSIAIDTAPSFSPDGQYISFVSNRSGLPHIYRLSVNNPTRVERLTKQGRYNQDPDYSPSGKSIVFSGRDEKYQFDLFLYDIPSGSISRLTQNQGRNENPSFSPDGRLLLFTSDRLGRTGLFLSTLDGKKQEKIFVGFGNIITPAWSPVPKNNGAKK
ncbi:PD40 domain-containing protein [bacterium]|nr:PD40 domain-containing protein [bacterium]